MSVHLFQYDIPEVRVWSPRRGRYYKRPVIKNPSHQLWRAGAARCTDSCWLIREARIPNSIITTFKANAVVWFSAPFDPVASESLAQMAIHSIRKEIKEYIERAQESAKAAQERLDNAGRGQVAIAHKKFRETQAAIIARVRKAIARVSIAATEFSLPEVLTGVATASRTLDGLKAVLERKADAYAKAHDIIVRAHGKKAPMAKAIEADDVFGPIISDYLDDEINTPEARSTAKVLREIHGFDF